MNGRFLLTRFTILVVGDTHPVPCFLPSVSSCICITWGYADMASWASGQLCLGCGLLLEDSYVGVWFFYGTMLRDSENFQRWFLMGILLVTG